MNPDQGKREALISGQLGYTQFIAIDPGFKMFLLFFSPGIVKLCMF